MELMLISSLFDKNKMKRVTERPLIRASQSVFVIKVEHFLSLICAAIKCISQWNASMHCDDFRGGVGAHTFSKIKVRGGGIYVHISQSIIESNYLHASH